MVQDNHYIIVNGGVTEQRIWTVVDERLDEERSRLPHPIAHSLRKVGVVGHVIAQALQDTNDALVSSTGAVVLGAAVAIVLRGKIGKELT
jgi:hypothetical protein